MPTPAPTQSRRRAPVATAVLASLALFVAGCGDDDGDVADATTTTDAPATTTDAPATTTEAPEADQPDDGPETGLLVDDAGDEPDSEPGDGVCATADGACTLRAAVDEANAASTQQTITLEVDVTLAAAGADEDANATGDLDLTADVVIDGGGWTVDAAGMDRIFHVQGVAASISNITLTNGVVEGEGASGGAILNEAGDLTVSDSVLTDSTATRAGGAIEANEGTTTLTTVELSGNSTGDGPGNGGGLHLTGAGQVTVTDSMVRNNTATAEGGGLWNSEGGIFDIVDTTIEGNVASGPEADQGGGGLYNDGGTMTVTGSTIDANIADGAAGSGGGILNNLGTLTVTDTAVTGNESIRAGGGIEANEGTTTLTTAGLSGNSTGESPGNGGGLHLTGAGEVTVAGSMVAENSAAAEGGGLWNSATGLMTVTDTEATGNQSPVGADLYNDGGTFTVDGEPAG